MQSHESAYTTPFRRNGVPFLAKPLGGTDFPPRRLPDFRGPGESRPPHRPPPPTLTPAGSRPARDGVHLDAARRMPFG